MSEQADALEADPRFPSGPWEGFWIQRYAPAGKHRTELHITFAGGVLRGEGRDWVGRYTVTGRYDVADGRCHWVKRYVSKHDVQYNGFNEGKGIWGTWEISMLGTRWTGGFHIWPKGMPDPSVPALHEEADLPAEVPEAEPVAVS